MVLNDVATMNGNADGQIPSMWKALTPESTSDLNSLVNEYMLVSSFRTMVVNSSIYIVYTVSMVYT